MTEAWQPINTAPDGELVDTKIDDEHGGHKPWMADTPRQSLVAQGWQHVRLLHANALEADMTALNPYAYWMAALAGEKPKAIIEQCELGFYRRGLYQRDGKGNNKRVGWQPVAVFMDGDVMTARIGNEADGRDVTGDSLGELWSYIAGNAISEETYRAVSRGEPWPDARPKTSPELDTALSALLSMGNIPAANRDVAKDDNAAEILAELLPEVAHATAIDNAISAAIKKVTNEPEAAQALGSKNRIAELRLAADKAGKSLYQPPYQEYQRLYGIWNPPVKRAEAKEKELNTIILMFRESEHKRIAKEQADADAKQRDLDEANERAAQRAIAAAEPEPEPIVETVEQPASLAPIAPTYGTRKLKEEMKTFLDEVTDWDAVYQYFKNTTEVKMTLTVLATAAIRAGDTIPGTTSRRGLI